MNDDLGIGLIIFKQDVVARLVLLNQGILQNESLSFRAHDDIFDASYLTHKQPSLRALYISLEVAADTSTKVLCLPYIDNLTSLPNIFVATWGFR